MDGRVVCNKAKHTFVCITVEVTMVEESDRLKNSLFIQHEDINCCILYYVCILIYTILTDNSEYIHAQQ